MWPSFVTIMIVNWSSGLKKKTNKKLEKKKKEKDASHTCNNYWNIALIDRFKIKVSHIYLGCNRMFVPCLL